MPFYYSGEIKYFRFSSLENHGINHAIFTRRGGFSSVPWKSLNFGGSVGDDRVKVAKNREIALQTVNIETENVYDVYQVHSTDIVTTDRPLHHNEIHQKADAILTNQLRITLLMRFADCVPILLYDPTIHAIGIVHAGWKGTVNRIAKNAVLSMISNYGTNPADIIAAIGPSIGPDHYQVGQDVIDLVYENLRDEADQCILFKKDRGNFDLWKANQLILNETGVNKIEIAGMCTCCNLSDWYSHRGENGMTGRFGVVIGLL